MAVIKLRCSGCKTSCFYCTITHEEKQQKLNAFRQCPCQSCLIKVVCDLRCKPFDEFQDEYRM